ncbi:MAG: hypothetical protein A3B91_04305 [Candidatus Yanofskybacteria bacterium RIFCSPHIGHO2_02_FULL_41_29]|uniref:NERD domain-containing protein n=1 Tax=Candidatus Yanofskybacteria bacterium RIFCSPHIGHO2_01_FULL_41_53 TaxID=1802663 RepID=A0A1F8EK40_9BACT|nr:MAG: hypothetical protein A2650_03565 [Candidatus Yanofskybacteria bacterium RIFCSPHIGHO2_01_FULL_41_53]OGN11746.1 MAG: hypothetical protein A3B91_04305 [Candidatus Yanofskybacteria bacterium RIFCSPHIGHO2_02_FULL_41_29]OGN17511.1 MAG: hypothetical protein A3F48_01865 [Candidatus Yanofskybacteria bacterium RIFCSPHIGHO2_12_FULL_41_9]OGN22900.1 MAG: hypothetical protein A2916_00760 [Candidatus Yanofskybacteria bacterium RIFCSPLOWO2_01_FULL_41_67]OGN30282.1 MAG: hypothetical protein A3H54_05160 
MIGLAQKLFSYLFLVILVAVIAFVNWRWPFYNWFGDTPIYRFIWLGIFFILFDFTFEILSKALKQVRLMAEAMSFGKDLKKISDGFKVVHNVSLPSHLIAEYVVVGSSGVWLLSLRDDWGRIKFNGDDLVRDGQALKGLFTGSLEKSYALASFIKEKLGRNFIVSSVIIFLSNKAYLEEVPSNIRGVFISSRGNAISLIENTDIQLIDQKTIEDIVKIFKK